MLSNRPEYLTWVGFAVVGRLFSACRTGQVRSWMTLTTARQLFLAASHSTLTRPLRSAYDRLRSPGRPKLLADGGRRRKIRYSALLHFMHGRVSKPSQVSTKAQAQPCGFVSGEPGRFGSAQLCLAHHSPENLPGRYKMCEYGRL